LFSFFFAQEYFRASSTTSPLIVSFFLHGFEHLLTAKLQRMAKEIERLTDALTKQVNMRRGTNAQLQAMSEAAIAQSFAEYDAIVADKTRSLQREGLCVGHASVVCVLKLKLFR